MGNGYMPFVNFEKSSIRDIWQGPKNALHFYKLKYCCTTFLVE